MSLEDTLRSWAGPPSDTEQDKADNAARIVREALDDADVLSEYPLTVSAQGSYRANTNVWLDSDVDLCIVHTGQYLYDLSLSDLADAMMMAEDATLRTLMGSSAL